MTTNTRSATATTTPAATAQDAVNKMELHVGRLEDAVDLLNVLSCATVDIPPGALNPLLDVIRPSAVALRDTFKTMHTLMVGMRIEEAARAPRPKLPAHLD